jgi:hypothetical protein
MDNNQQAPSKPAGKPDLSAQTSPGNGASATLTNVDAASKMGVPSPLTGADVSMTTAQKAGGKIVTTEAGSKN